MLRQKCWLIDRQGDESKVRISLEFEMRRLAGGALPNGAISQLTVHNLVAVCQQLTDSYFGSAMQDVVIYIPREIARKSNAYLATLENRLYEIAGENSNLRITVNIIESNFGQLQVQRRQQFRSGVKFVILHLKSLRR